MTKRRRSLSIPFMATIVNCVVVIILALLLTPAEIGIVSIALVLAANIATLLGLILKGVYLPKSRR
jgi:amino acid transporter